MTAAAYLESQGIKKKKQTKYNAKRTEVDGLVFDSLTEAKRYGELKMLLRAGEIQNLDLQPRYSLHAHGVSQGRFTADFRYHEEAAGKTLIIVEDVKSIATAKRADYKQKVKLFQACYPHLIFREVIR